jgi:hypothetical protein
MNLLTFNLSSSSNAHAERFGYQNQCVTAAFSRGHPVEMGHPVERGHPVAEFNIILKIWSDIV